MGARRSVVSFGLLLIVVLTGGVAPLHAQSADALFDASVLHELRLHVHSADLARLRAHADENTYYPADLEWRGQRVRNVAIRSRGLGSRNPIKLGLRVDMDRYTSGQRFLGLSALVLDNLWQDASLLREPLAMTVFARMDIAAPREAFARLYINDVYEGLYSMVEEVAPPFLERIFGRDDGYLFEYNWVRPWYWDYLGEDVEAYAELFEAQTHENRPAEELYGAIREWTRLAADEAADAAWLESIARYVDVQQLLTYVAVESTLSQLDGLLGYDGTNNFYVHRPLDSTRHVVIPWDQDFAFFDVTSSIWLRADQNTLVRHLLAVPALRARYVDEVERCVALLSDGEWLAGELERAIALTDAAARDDVRKQYGEAERAAALDQLREFARGRAARVRIEVEQARRQEEAQP